MNVTTVIRNGQPTIVWERFLDDEDKPEIGPCVDTVDVVFPARWEVCNRCSGTGRHDPPGFADGFTREDFDRDPGFREEYLRGDYDVTCSCCLGRTTAAVLDEDACDPELLKLYDAALDDWCDYQNQVAAERRYGA